MVRVREDLGSLQEGGWAAPSQQREGSGAGGAEPWTAPAALCPWVCEGGRHLGQVGTVVQCFWRTHPEPLSPVGWGHFNLWGCARGGVHSLDNEDLGALKGQAKGHRVQGDGAWLTFTQEDTWAGSAETPSTGAPGWAPSPTG